MQNNHAVNPSNISFNISFSNQTIMKETVTSNQSLINRTYYTSILACNSPGSEPDNHQVSYIARHAVYQSATRSSIHSADHLFIHPPVIHSFILSFILQSSIHS